MWTGRFWCSRCAETYREWLFREERKNGVDAHMALESEKLVVPDGLSIPVSTFPEVSELFRDF